MVEGAGYMQGRLLCLGCGGGRTESTLTAHNHPTTATLNLFNAARRTKA
jgi:hypothetical protein